MLSLPKRSKCPTSKNYEFLKFFLTLKAKKSNFILTECTNLNYKTKEILDGKTSHVAVKNFIQDEFLFGILAEARNIPRIFRQVDPKLIGNFVGQWFR